MTNRGFSRGHQNYIIVILSEVRNLIIAALVKSPKFVTSAKSRIPDVVPAKAGNHLKDWIPVFTGNPGFLSPQEFQIGET